MGGARRQCVLVIEDDQSIRRGLNDALAGAGYAVLQAGDGNAGLEAALTGRPDVVLLDLMLPGLCGLEVLERLRRSSPTLPIVILTALGGEDDRVRGLRLGADDYVVKPFGVRELLARVEAVLRRSPARPAEARRVRFPGGLADLERNEIHYDDGRICELSEIEGRLLAYLAGSAGRVVLREELLMNVWRVRPQGLETRTVDMHVSRLRSKLGRAGTALRTVRGKGYLFEPDGGRP